MMPALLIYSYATGTFSSRRIEQSTYDSVPVRLLTADTHPDHDTICTFRRENQAMAEPLSRAPQKEIPTRPHAPGRGSTRDESSPFSGQFEASPGPDEW